MSNNANSFDFLELGQAIQDVREKQRITREELAEELGISARHLQSVEKEAVSELSAVYSACYNVPHIRRPVHTQLVIGIQFRTFRA